jgi:transcription elongation factor Elf1
VRVVCPCCGAGTAHLTLLELDDGYVRACRRCDTRFDLEV